MPYATGCHHCGSPCDGASCEPCKAKRRETERARRDDRRARGLCLTCGAPVARMKTIAGGTRVVRQPAKYCVRHLAYYRQRANT